MPWSRKQAYNILDKAEPWTSKEEAMFTNQERNFMRNIQLSRQMDKGQARKFYMNYAHASVKQRDKIRKSIMADIREMYPKHKTMRLRTEGKFHRPREKVVSPKEPIKFSHKYSEFESWVSTQKEKGLEDSPQFKRVVKAHERYPEDSLYQLQHGHNVYILKEPQEERSPENTEV